MAGKNWLTNFIKRNPTLSVRCPKAVSPISGARATTFNRRTVSAFYGKLKELLEKYKFEAHEIWNFSKTSI